jgi:hypothetical protein
MKLGSLSKHQPGKRGVNANCLPGETAPLLFSVGGPMTCGSAHAVVKQLLKM